MQHSSRQHLPPEELHEPAAAQGKCAQHEAPNAGLQSVPRGQLPPESTRRCVPLLTELQGMSVELCIFISLICGQGQAS